MVYDITKERTFENLERWIAELKQQASKNVVVFVVGNKLDLIEKNSSLRWVHTH